MLPTERSNESGRSRWEQATSGSPRSVTSRGSPPSSVTDNHAVRPPAPSLPTTCAASSTSGCSHPAGTPRSASSSSGSPVRTGATPPTPTSSRHPAPDALPGGSKVTFEPGRTARAQRAAARRGSPPRAATWPPTCEAVRRRARHRRGIELVATGLDPHGPRPRVVDAPRYRAMEHYFDTHWPEGRTMMRNTASIQVNLDIGRDERDRDALAARPRSRPGARGRVRELAARRVRATHRLAIDAARGLARDRSRPHGLGVRAGSRRACVVDAVHARRTGDDDPHRRRRTCTALDRPLPVRASGSRNGHELGWPTLEDFDYHLTTLFPPIRPRGWLEFRMIDALPDAVVAGRGRGRGHAARRRRSGRRRGSARSRPPAAAGSPPPATASPTRRSAPRPTPASRAVLEALPASRHRRRHDRRGRPSFHDRYVARGRCPADDVLRDWDELPAATA